MIINIDVQFITPNRHVDTVFLHCSASDQPHHDDISVIRDWHVNGNGWSDVAYHYFITSKGEIQPGRSLEKSPAAQAGFNGGTIAICVSGLSRFSEVSLFACRELCLTIKKEYELLGQVIRFRGHREVSNKTCPVFDYKALLNLNANGYVMDSMAIMDTPIEEDLPVLRLMDASQSVGVLQILLDIQCDCIFGQVTKAEVMAFQQFHGLVEDGIVGKRTWAKLIEVAAQRSEGDDG